MKFMGIMISLLILIFCFFLTCERTTPLPQKTDEFSQLEPGSLSNIPLEYGQLITITSPQAGIAHLWFQDDSSTIRMVQFNYGKNLITPDVRIITRK